MITGGLLSHWRQSLEISQANMARLLGVPFTTYVKWEHNTRTPPTVATNAIALLHWLEQSHPTVFDAVWKVRLKQDRKGVHSRTLQG